MTIIRELSKSFSRYYIIAHSHGMCVYVFKVYTYTKSASYFHAFWLQTFSSLTYYQNVEHKKPHIACQSFFVAWINLMLRVHMLFWFVADSLTKNLLPGIKTQNAANFQSPTRNPYLKKNVIHENHMEIKSCGEERHSSLIFKWVYRHIFANSICSFSNLDLITPEEFFFYDMAAAQCQCSIRLGSTSQWLKIWYKKYGPNHVSSFIYVQSVSFEVHRDINIVDNNGV